jgi:hypothetical protein
MLSMHANRKQKRKRKKPNPNSLESLLWVFGGRIPKRKARGLAAHCHTPPREIVAEAERSYLRYKGVNSLWVTWISYAKIDARSFQVSSIHESR